MSAGSGFNGFLASLPHIASTKRYIHTDADRLFEAIDADDPQAVAKHLHTRPQDVQTRYQGATPLNYALIRLINGVNQNKPSVLAIPEIIKELLAANIDPNARFHGLAPLHQIAALKHSGTVADAICNIAEQLLAAKADPHAQVDTEANAFAMTGTSGIKGNMLGWIIRRLPGATPQGLARMAGNTRLGDILQKAEAETPKPLPSNATDESMSDQEKLDVTDLPWREAA